MNYALLPEHIRAGTKRYIENGVRPGSFLRAVICNDLQKAVVFADAVNRAQLYTIVAFWHNEAPENSWGSPERMEAWIAHEGLRGAGLSDVEGGPNA